VVVAAVNDILAIAEAICPSAAAQLRFHLGNTCLNSSQIKQFESIIDGVQILFT
jgi:hypothetical protein